MLILGADGLCLVDPAPHEANREALGLHRTTISAVSPAVNSVCPSLRTHIDPETSCPLFMVSLDANLLIEQAVSKEAQASLVAQG